MKQTLLLFCLFCVVGLSAQTDIDWSDLARGITWREGGADETYPGFLKANFSYKMIDLEGKKVSLTGYFLALEGEQAIYMLSKNPMASCFFCGNGGPETVTEVTFAEKPRFVTDDLITVTGTLRLNGDDPTRCYYHIEKAEGFGF